MRNIISQNQQDRYSQRSPRNQSIDAMDYRIPSPSSSKPEKIPNPIVREKGEASRGRLTAALSYHSLRHTFNTQLEAVYVSEVTRMRLSDHSTPSINRDYIDSEMSHLIKEINKIPSIPGKRIN